jgi:hypothetical protein
MWKNIFFIYLLKKNRYETKRLRKNEWSLLQDSVELVQEGDGGI